ncbi:MAG TPA: methyltransferase domain-containing protein [Marmoricola sp.]|nr:methyltransferase domain-containing protein [Marmoricola sp.]
MSQQWDPARYLQYADQRGRPFVELLARVPVDRPDEVVDLGCGPGNLTALAAGRWPDARTTGIDSSAEMVERARADFPALDFVVADLREWAGEGEPVDVLLSNATLQWVPGHLDLLRELLSRVRPGGCLAFQVPGNFTEPSHTLRQELALRPPYAEHLEGSAEPDAHDAATYLRALQRLGCAVDAWESTYLHVLTGPDPVFDWVLGTSARPMLQRLPDDLVERFADEFRTALRAAYPDDGNGVVLPFRRVFVVAQKPASEEESA